MPMYKRIKEQFADHIETQIDAAETLPTAIVQSGERLVQALLNGHKILTCGNGSSACDAQRFSAHLLNRYNQERPALPAITLTADSTTLTSIASDYSFTDIYSKQVNALGKPGDVLLVITPDGNTENILHAISAAHKNNMTVIALTGNDGGQVGMILDEFDVEIRVKSNNVARIQETHVLIIHCLCDTIDFCLFNCE
jgi:DnaA initiator-associating protein